mgnify:CR=1 FL=1
MIYFSNIDGETSMSEVVEGELLPHENESIDLGELDDDSILLFTQKTRKELAIDITRRGMPVDKDERATLLQTLRDMDQTAINRKRLNVDAANSENDSMVADIVRKMYELNPRGRRVTESEVVERIITVNSSALDQYSFTDDEKKIGLPKETAKDFLERMDDKLDSSSE